jgi:hypothetical protein
VIRQKHSKHSQLHNPWGRWGYGFFEEGGHELVVTSDKDGLDSEFERELPDAPPAALGTAYYAQSRRPAAG